MLRQRDYGASSLFDTCVRAADIRILHAHLLLLAAEIES